MPELVYQVGGEEQRLPLGEGELSIGRAPENDLVINDSSISRRHATVSKVDGRWRVRDLGSKNGTQVNDAPAEAADLHDGDRVLLGNFAIEFVSEVEQSVELKTTPSGSRVDESTGTVFRNAVDFSALAQGGAAREQQGADVDRLQTLLAIVTSVSHALLSPVSLDEILAGLLDQVFEHLPVERGCIMLWDGEKKDLVATTVKVRGKDEAEPGEFAISRTIAEKVYSEKVAVLTADAQQDDRFAGGASIMALGIRSAMAAPLWRGDDVHGILYVDTPLHVKAFDDFDLDLLSALGNHVALALEQSRLQASILDEKLSRERLERYHSPAVVARIKEAGEGDVLTAEERDVTVLFADVVGFTSRCETMEPRDVAAMLNRVFSKMADMIFRHDGTLDKFIGDCLMAVFGAPLPMEDHAVRGVQSAIDMREALDELNENVSPEERVEFRVGIHSGKVVAGDMGSVRRRDYTVLGSNVNLAARLESAVAKPGQIVISDVTRELVAGRFELELVGEFQPKGISRPVTAYEVKGVLATAEDEITRR